MQEWIQDDFLNQTQSKNIWSKTWLYIALQIFDRTFYLNNDPWLFVLSNKVMQLRILRKQYLRVMCTFVQRERRKGTTDTYLLSAKE